MNQRDEWLGNCRCLNVIECDCANGYCLTKTFARKHNEWDDKLQAALEGCDYRVLVQHDVRFQFCGIELILKTDGTYELNDTTGG